jgi:uncharacterized protein YkwD
MSGRRFAAPLGWLVLAAFAAGCAQRLAPVPAPVVPSPAPVAARPLRLSVPAGTEITSDCGIPRLRDTVLKQVNAARAIARSCGAKPMKAARELVWNRSLAVRIDVVEEAARRHVHRVPFGGLGQRVSQRVSAQGYKWRTVGENLAGGDSTVAGVIAGWLGSPEHCQNMMSPAYAEVGVACVRQPGSKWGNYWTMVLATRR